MNKTDKIIACICIIITWTLAGLLSAQMHKSMDIQTKLLINNSVNTVSANQVLLKQKSIDDLEQKLDMAEKDSQALRIRLSEIEAMVDSEFEKGKYKEVAARSWKRKI